MSVNTRMSKAEPSAKQGAKQLVSKTIAMVQCQCSDSRKAMDKSSDTCFPSTLPTLNASYALKHIGAWASLLSEEGSIPHTLDFDDDDDDDDDGDDGDGNGTSMSNDQTSCSPDFLEDVLDLRARVARHICFTNVTLVAESVVYPANSWPVSDVETETLCEDTFDFEPEHMRPGKEHTSAITIASPKLSAMSQVEALCKSSLDSRGLDRNRPLHSGASHLVRS